MTKNKATIKADLYKEIYKNTLSDYRDETAAMILNITDRTIRSYRRELENGKHKKRNTFNNCN